MCLFVDERARSEWRNQLTVVVPVNQITSYHLSNQFLGRPVHAPLSHCLRASTAVQIPGSLLDEDNNPNDLDVVETVCYSIILDSELIRLYDASQTTNGMFSPFTYFGSWSGVMRAYPGVRIFLRRVWRFERTG